MPGPGIFKEAGGSYRSRTLVLFSGTVQSACGYAESAMGPFYCPPDQKVYIDLDFYRDLRSRFAAPGDFAQAYVIAHEVGPSCPEPARHRKEGAPAPRARMNKADANALSVRVELQADCFAGIWAHQVEAQDANLTARTRRYRRRPQAPPAPSATTACNARPPAASSPTASPMAAPPSASAGSNAASTPATSEACDTFNADKL